MKTLGVDLSAAPARTASCLIRWGEDRVVVEPPVRPCTFSDLCVQLAGADHSALDAPFGWPVEFLAWVVRYSEGLTPDEVEPANMRLRQTDWFVHAARQAMAAERLWRKPYPPLSVSSDKIASVAVVAGRLLSAVSPDGTIDRLGEHGVVEAYPAATLELLGLSTLGYKADDALAVRVEMLDELERQSGGWLQLDDELRLALCASDHDFDAFVCSLTSRMAALGLTREPQTADQRERAPVEGWIQLPRDTLVMRQLAGS